MKGIQGNKKRWVLSIDRACAGIIITKFTFLLNCWKFAVFLNRRRKKHWRIQLCCSESIYSYRVRRQTCLNFGSACYPTFCEWAALIWQFYVLGSRVHVNWAPLVMSHLWCSRYLPWTWCGYLCVDALLPRTDRSYWYAILAVQLLRELRLCALGGRDCRKQSVVIEQWRGAYVSVGTATSIVTDRKFPVFKKFRNSWRVYSLKFWFLIFPKIYKTTSGRIIFGFMPFNADCLQP